MKNKIKKSEKGTEPAIRHLCNNFLRTMEFYSFLYSKNVSVS